MYLNSECTPTIILNSEPKTSSYNTKGVFMRLLNDANPCEVHERNFSIVSAIGQFFLVCLFVCSFDCSFVRSFVYQFALSFV